MHQQPSQGMAGVDTDSSTGHARISAPMVEALEQAWADIRTRHADLPPAVVVLGAGSIGTAAGVLKLGHFAAMRWADTTSNGQRLAEVFVGGEGLVRDPAEVLGTLLHEAAHALAHVRGIQDTSRQGRWHNARFKAVADEVGIQVTKDRRIGWSPTTVHDDTRTVYANTIAVLSDALRLFRSADITTAKTGKSSNPPACVCDCGRRIRVAACRACRRAHHMRHLRRRLHARPMTREATASQAHGTDNEGEHRHEHHDGPVLREPRLGA
jgi:hypothetical protein